MKPEPRTSPFSEKELQTWRRRLLAKGQEISGDIADLLREVNDVEPGNPMPTHPADRGSETDFQEFSLSTVQDEGDLLWQIERAIRKIDTGRPMPFGLCEHTGKPIERSRLNLMPWTPLSVEAVEAMEAENRTLQDMVIEEE